MIKLHVVNVNVAEEVLLALHPAVLQQALEDIMAGARAFWIQEAGKRLSSSRRDYVAGIQPVESGDGFASVELVGDVPHRVEDGMDPFDMHDTLLGPNVPVAPFGEKGKRQAADGHFYRAIPFRHQTPGTIGQGGGVPMGNAYAGHPAVKSARSLGKKVHAEAFTLTASTGSPYGKTQWGARLPPGLAPKLKAHHAVDIYAGMVRLEKTYVKAKQNTYMTFRMISDAVEDKWLHPGIRAERIADDVSKYVDNIAEKAILALVPE